MEFWIFMILFIYIGGGCSLAGTWWSKKQKEKNQKNNNFSYQDITKL